MFKKLTSLIGKFFDENPLLGLLLFALMGPFILMAGMIIFPVLWLGEKLGLPEYLRTFLAVVCLFYGIYIIGHNMFERDSNSSGNTGCISLSGSYEENC